MEDNFRQCPECELYEYSAICSDRFSNGSDVSKIRFRIFPLLEYICQYTRDTRNSLEFQFCLNRHSFLPEDSLFGRRKQLKIFLQIFLSDSQPK